MAGALVVRACLVVVVDVDVGVLDLVREEVDPHHLDEALGGGAHGLRVGEHVVVAHVGPVEVVRLAGRLCQRDEGAAGLAAGALLEERLGDHDADGARGVVLLAGERVVDLGDGGLVGVVAARDRTGAQRKQALIAVGELVVVVADPHDLDELDVVVADPLVGVSDGCHDAVERAGVGAVGTRACVGAGADGVTGGGQHQGLAAAYLLGEDLHGLGRVVLGLALQVEGQGAAGAVGNAGVGLDLLARQRVELLLKGLVGVKLSGFGSLGVLCWVCVGVVGLLAGALLALAGLVLGRHGLGHGHNLGVNLGRIALVLLVGVGGNVALVAVAVEHGDGQRAAELLASKRLRREGRVVEVCSGLAPLVGSDGGGAGCHGHVIGGSKRAVHGDLCVLGQAGKGDGVGERCGLVLGGQLLGAVGGAQRGGDGRHVHASLAVLVEGALHDWSAVTGQRDAHQDVGTSNVVQVDALELGPVLSGLVGGKAGCQLHGILAPLVGLGHIVRLSEQDLSGLCVDELDGGLIARTGLQARVLQGEGQVVVECGGREGRVGGRVLDRQARQLRGRLLLGLCGRLCRGLGRGGSGLGRRLLGRRLLGRGLLGRRLGDLLLGGNLLYLLLGGNSLLLRHNVHTLVPARVRDGRGLQHHGQAQQHGEEPPQPLVHCLPLCFVHPLATHVYSPCLWVSFVSGVVGARRAGRSATHLNRLPAPCS